MISATLSDPSRSDLDSSKVHISIDGVEWTQQSSVSIEFDEDNADGGYPIGSVSFTPIVPLTEGTHTVEIHAGDLAGNIEVVKWTFTVLKEILPGDAIEEAIPVEITLPEDFETIITSSGEIITYTNTEDFTINVAEAGADGDFSGTRLTGQGSEVFAGLRPHPVRQEVRRNRICGQCLSPGRLRQDVRRKLRGSRRAGSDRSQGM